MITHSQLTSGQKKSFLLLASLFLAFLAIFTLGSAVTASQVEASTVADTIQFQAPSPTTQYYVYAWDNSGTIDNGSGTGFTAIPLTQKNGVETLVLNVPASDTSFNFFITDGNSWSNNPNKIDGAGNGLLVNSGGKAYTSYVTQKGYGISEPTTTNAGLINAAFATADEYQAAQVGSFTGFDEQWAYQGSDLGASYSSTGTTFKLWAPTATSVNLISYGTNNSPTAAKVSTTAMTRGITADPNNHTDNTIGVWSLTVPGNENGLVYQYQITFGDGTVSDFYQTTGKPAYGTYTAASTTNTTQDPYTIAVTQGGLRSVVENPSGISSNLTLAQGTAATWRVASPTQAIVDELHIRDFTESTTSGVSAANRGKYLGVIQPGTTDPNTGTPTGLNYLETEGFNYVQLMPVSEFASVPEAGVATPAQPNIYNWGYDPENEMVPEGEYASNSVTSTTRINEMKEMVQGLHSNGIGVVMDMVLNHVYSQSNSALELAEPGYYFRNSANSGCGNDTASNHEMFQKYIIDSVTYWAKNYDIDGFRFDEMSLLDATTMSKLRAALSAIDPHIIMYGEGWGTGTDGTWTPSTASNATLPQLQGIGFFNAGERDNVRGLNAQAFVDGNTSSTQNVVNALLASGNGLQSFSTPSQAVNYVECHDSLNLNDQLWANDPADSQATHASRDELANAVNIMADGITFMETGQEYDQSKLVDPTSGASVSPSTASSSAWSAASWGLAANSYNGIAYFDSTTGAWFGGKGALPTTDSGTNYYVGDAVNDMNWDNVKVNSSAVSFLAQLMKFKEANPQFWPNSYSSLFSANSPMTITNPATGAAILYGQNVPQNGVITMELKSGSTDDLVIINASGGSITLGSGASYYNATSFSGKTLLLSSDTSLSSQTGNALSSTTVTVANLTTTVIQLSK